MIKLRVVGTTPDGDALLLSNKPKGRKGSHQLAIDGRLIAVLEGVFDERRSSRRPALQSKSLPTAVEPPRVPPRELQRMLRAGQSVAQVARSTGASEEYIEQFYPPVLYERDGVIRDAQGLSIEKSRLGISGLPLGDAVLRNLVQRRVRLDEDDLARAWSATRRDGEPWQVTLTFPFRGRSHRAVWTYDPRTREIEPSNKVALDIGWVAEGARPAPRGESTKASRPKRAARKTTSKKRARPKRKAAKKPARKVAKKRPPRKVAKKPARRAAKRPARKAAKKRPARKAAKKTARKPARKASRKPARKPARRRPTKRPARRAVKRATRRTSARKKSRRR